MDNTKRTVLTIGCISVAASLVGALMNMSIVEFLFPIYTGFVLMGTVLLNKEEKCIEA